jgi:hypothetical protein
VAGARMPRLAVALALSGGGQPDESMVACRQRAALSGGSVTGGLAPRATELSITTEIGFSGPFFTRSWKIVRVCQGEAAVQGAHENVRWVPVLVQRVSVGAAELPTCARC